LLSNPSLIDQAVKQGYILTPFFNEQLALYEKSQDVMKLFFPQMIAALSVKHEIARLEGVEFAKQLPQSPASKSPAPQPVISASAQTLAQADNYYDRQDLQNARQLYERALQQPGGSIDHARAYYGLAHVALRQKRPEAADQYFRKTLDSSPEPDVRAWSCYYLGQLSALAEQPEEAMDWYRKALAVDGAPPKAIEFTRREIAKLAPSAK
jgi:tetratricopeptide (TPR) repeat protein